MTVTPPGHNRGMALEQPRTLSPSKVAAFTECALAFRFATIDRLPEPASPWTTKGTLVHAALERLFLLEPTARTLAAALICLDEAFTMIRTDAEYTDLHLSPDDEAAFVDDAERLVRQYFTLEDPTTLPDQSSRAIERKVGAIWSAVERACERDDFRPKPSRLCEYCAFRVYCPAFGGDIAEGARVAAAIRSTATVADLVPTAVAH